MLYKVFQDLSMSVDVLVNLFRLATNQNLENFAEVAT
jgi:hypothetical protein